MMRTLSGSLQVHRGGQLGHGHLEPAVAHDGAHQVVGPGELGADGRGEAEPHRARAAGGDPVEALVGAVELGGPHLVLPHVRGDDGLAARSAGTARR